MPIHFVSLSLILLAPWSLWCHITRITWVSCRALHRYLHQSIIFRLGYRLLSFCSFFLLVQIIMHIESTCFPLLSTASTSIWPRAHQCNQWCPCRALIRHKLRAIYCARERHFILLSLPQGPKALSFYFSLARSSLPTMLKWVPN